MATYSIDITVHEHNAHNLGIDDCFGWKFNYNINYNGDSDNLDIKKLAELIIRDLLFNDVEFIKNFCHNKTYTMPETADELDIEVYRDNDLQVRMNSGPYIEDDHNNKSYRTYSKLTVDIKIKNLEIKNLGSSADDDTCKWIEYDYRTMCPSNHGNVDNPYWRIPYDAVHLSFCPYCGKKIRFIDRDGVVRW